MLYRTISTARTPTRTLLLHLSRPSAAIAGRRAFASPLAGSGSSMDKKDRESQEMLMLVRTFAPLSKSRRKVGRGKEGD